VLVPDNVYGQNRYLTESWLPQWGVTHRFYDPLTVPELRETPSWSGWRRRLDHAGVPRPAGHAGGLPRAAC
jgi:hypothetical protein